MERQVTNRRSVDVGKETASDEERIRTFVDCKSSCELENDGPRDSLQMFNHGPRNEDHGVEYIQFLSGLGYFRSYHIE